MNADLFWQVAQMLRGERDLLENEDAFVLFGLEHDEVEGTVFKVAPQVIEGIV